MPRRGVLGARQGQTLSRSGTGTEQPAVSVPLQDGETEARASHHLQNPALGPAPQLAPPPHSHLTGKVMLVGPGWGQGHLLLLS